MVCRWAPSSHLLKDGFTLRKVLDAFRSHLRDNGMTGAPKTITVDDDDAEISAIEACDWAKEGTRVGLCFWHTLRCWDKHLLLKVPGVGQRKLRDDMKAALRNVAEALVRPLSYNC